MWRKFVKNEVTKSIFTYLESNKQTGNDPYGHLRTKTNVGERTEMAKKIFSSIQFKKLKIT